MKIVSRILFVCTFIGLSFVCIQAASPQISNELDVPDSEQNSVIMRAQKIVNSLPKVGIDPQLAKAASNFKKALSRFNACVTHKRNCSWLRRGLYITALVVVSYFAIVIMGGLYFGHEEKKLLDQIDLLRNDRNSAYIDDNIGIINSGPAREKLKGLRELVGNLKQGFPRGG